MVRSMLQRSAFLAGFMVIFTQFSAGQTHAKNNSSLPRLNVKEPEVVRPQSRGIQPPSSAPLTPADEARAFLLSPDGPRSRGSENLGGHKSYLEYFHPEEKQKLVKNLGLLSKKDQDEIQRLIKNELDRGSQNPPDRKTSELSKQALDIQTAMNIRNIVRAKVGEKMIFNAIQKTADNFGYVIATRAVNKSSLPGIAEDLPTKPMAIKGKSADSDFLAGYIPVNQAFSKIGKDPEAATHYNELNHKALKEHPESFKAIPLMKAHPTERGRKLLLVQDQAGVQKWIDSEDLGKTKEQLTPIEVMGAKVSGSEEFAPVVADLDPLFIAIPLNLKSFIETKGIVGKGRQVTFEKEKGAITSLYPEVIDKMNEIIGNKNSVVHHGGAELDPSNTPLEHEEKVFISIPGGGAPIVLQGTVGGPSTQDLVDEFMTTGPGKGFKSVGTNESMRNITVSPPSQDELSLKKAVRMEKMIKKAFSPPASLSDSKKSKAQSAR